MTRRSGHLWAILPTLAMLLACRGPAPAAPSSAAEATVPAFEQAALAALGQGVGPGGLRLTQPLADTIFPPDLAPPTWRWADATQADGWAVRVAFADGREPLVAAVSGREWTPTDAQWQVMRDRSRDAAAHVTVVAVVRRAAGEPLASGGAAFTTSADPVGAPLFYREVNLPFIDAVKDPSLIRWRFGPVSSRTPPPVVLTGLPVCGNCHSFSADGKTLGMDVDYSNDKGSYALADTATETVLSRDKVITWSDFRREDGTQTFGLLSSVSPDGRFVVSTVKDRSVFVPTKDLEYSQLFFPVKGILAVYRRDTRTFAALPGADDPRFVQSNPSWSPDGKFIVFARATAYDLGLKHDKALLDPSEVAEFLSGGREFKFDLYRIPFNDGAGGVAEPIAGATGGGMSHFFARYSPDGRWIVFTQAKNFMLLQPDSTLWILPAQGGVARRMACNTPRMNSWHSWSPNGRWLVFSSKVHGPYTQLFLTHVDAAGLDSPPLVLDRFTTPNRAANIPEFVNLPPDGLRSIRDAFVDDASWVRAATLHFQAGDLPGAEAKFRKALQRNPNNVDAHRLLGIALARQGQPQEAIAHFRAVLLARPNDPEVHGNLAIVLATLGDHELAIEHLQLAVQAAPGDATLLFNLGQALMARQRHAEAVAPLRKAAVADPTSEPIRAALARALAGR
jgi:tetratricopeptide (TPR) repeat protein